MSQLTYVASASRDWTLLVHGALVVAVRNPASTDLVERLWSRLVEGISAGGILDVLTFGGISSAPEFVIVSEADTSATVLIRGSAVFSAPTTPPVTVSGAGVSSWVETVVDNSNDFEIDFDFAADGAALPLSSGVVFASRVSRVIGGVQDAPPLPASAAPGVDLILNAPIVAVEPSRQDVPIARPPVQAPPESVSELTLASSTMTQRPPVESVAEAVPESTGYDHLFGETVFRSVEGAAVRDGEDSPHPAKVVGPPPIVGDDGDHDGHTVMVSDMAALRRQRKQAKEAQAPAVSIPVLYVELSTGGRELLDQPLIIGRAPSASRVPGDRIPRMVSMNTPNQDISRTHAQIAVEGGSVVVTDLHSSNGTLVALPGKPSQKLRPGEPTTVIVGTVIDLGDGATLTVCESL